MVWTREVCSDVPGAFVFAVLHILPAKQIGQLWQFTPKLLPTSSFYSIIIAGVWERAKNRVYGWLIAIRKCIFAVFAVYPQFNPQAASHIYRPQAAEPPYCQGHLLTPIFYTYQHQQ
jgi:hypothetical protein